MNNIKYKIFGLAKSSDEGKKYLSIMVENMLTRETRTLKMAFLKDMTEQEVLFFTAKEFDCHTSNILVNFGISFRLVGINP